MMGKFDLQKVVFLCVGVVGFFCFLIAKTRENDCDMENGLPPFFRISCAKLNCSIS